MKLTNNYNTVTISTDITYAQFLATKRYKPEALVLKKDKEPVFMIDTAKEGRGSASANGIALDGVTADGAMFLTINKPGLAAKSSAEVKSMVKDEFGMVLYNMSKIEKQVAAAATKTEQALNSVEEAISIS